MSLIEHYHNALKQPDMTHDAAQEQAVAKLENLLLALQTEDKRTFFQILTQQFKNLFPSQQQKNKTQGLYLWGGVGRGKTWLMNLFFDELNITQKKRIHFHHFMLEIHEQLTAINNPARTKSKTKNPLKHIAKQIAKEYKVLCIDEFIVTNITDAMILSELLHALFKYKICLVATSNRVPDDLYLNGLQRDRFLPAIELIKTHTEVFHLDSGVDHRASLLENADTYYTPIDGNNTEQKIKIRMQELAITPIFENQVLTIQNREIQTLRASDEIACFAFDDICSTPRASQDYIELAQKFSTIILLDIPLLDEYSDDKARRFIYLIDELYDRNVTLIISAFAEPEKLYRGKMLEFAFHRTSSRLIEMRSQQYLMQSHRSC